MLSLNPTTEESAKRSQQKQMQFGERYGITRSHKDVWEV